MKRYKAYLLKNFNIPNDVFWLRRDAITQAKKNMGPRWREVYQIVKVVIEESN